MRKHVVLLEIALLAFSGCVFEPEEEDSEIMIIQGIAPELTGVSGTKVCMYDDSGNSGKGILTWGKDDQIVIVSHQDYNTTDPLLFTLYDGAGEQSAYFRGSTSRYLTNRSKVFAVYPYGAFDNNNAIKYMIVPAKVEQTYKKDSIDHGYLTSYAEGDVMSLDFKVKSSAIKLNLKASNSKKILSMVAISKIGGLIKKYPVTVDGSNFNIGAGQKYSESVDYAVDKQLNAGDSLQFYIAVAAGDYTDLCFHIYADDGTVASDSNIVTLKEGTVHVFNRNLTFDYGDVYFSYDGTNYSKFVGSLNIPSFATCIYAKTGDGYVISSAHLEIIKQAIETYKKDISLNLYNSTFLTTTFPLNFQAWHNTGSNQRIKNLVLPYNITSIPSSCFNFSRIDTLTIGALVKNIQVAFVTTITGIYFKVDGNNSDYCSHKGMLYNKDTTKLLAASPIAINDTAFVVHDSVQTIANAACAYNNSLKTLTLPKGLKEFNCNSFYSARSIHTINVKAINPPALKLDGGTLGENAKGTKVVYVPKEAVTAYESAWESFCSKYSYQIKGKDF